MKNFRFLLFLTILVPFKSYSEIYMNTIETIYDDIIHTENDEFWVVDFSRSGHLDIERDTTWEEGDEIKIFVFYDKRNKYAKIINLNSQDSIYFYEDKYCQSEFDHNMAKYFITCKEPYSEYY